MQRLTIHFESEEGTCAGWLYLPTNLEKPAPAIVMAHGFSLVKEAYLDKYAALFCENNFVVLVFDYRNFGESTVFKAQQIDPFEQIKDYRHAITWVSALPEVDAEQIGIWGTSYSGGHVLHIAAVDKRVKAVVAQVPTINGRKGMSRKLPAQKMQNLIKQLEKDRMNRYINKVDAVIPVVSQTEQAAQPHPDAYKWFMEAGEIAPNWKNYITLQSLELYMEYNPAGLMEFIAPTPLLVIAAMEDGITPPDLIIEAFEEWANEPKSLVKLPGGHFDVYNGPTFKEASEASLNWFLIHLQEKILNK